MRKLLWSEEHGDAGRLLEAMLKLAEGHPLIPRLPNGKEGPPIVPTAADCLRAQIELAHLYLGRPVTQDLIMAAEAASRELEEVRGLSDEELHARARQALERGLAGLDARKPLPSSEPAEVSVNGAGMQVREKTMEESPSARVGVEAKEKKSIDSKGGGSK